MGVAGTKHALNNGYGDHFEQDDLMTSSMSGVAECIGTVDECGTGAPTTQCCSQSQTMTNDGDVRGGSQQSKYGTPPFPCHSADKSQLNCLSGIDSQLCTDTSPTLTANPCASTAQSLPAPATNGEQLTQQQTSSPAVCDEAHALHSDWIVLRRCLRQFYWLHMVRAMHERGAGKTLSKDAEEEERHRRAKCAPSNLQTTIQQKAERLCVRDAHQLFLRLNGQLLELTGEVRLQLLGQIDAEPSSSSSPPSSSSPSASSSSALARQFLRSMLCYRQCMLEAADILTVSLAPLQSHMDSFGLTWRTLNDYAYCSVVYMEPILQNRLLDILALLSYEQQMSPTSTSTSISSSSNNMTTSSTTTTVATSTTTAVTASSVPATTALASLVRRTADVDLMEHYMDFVTDMVNSANQWRCAELQLQQLGQESGARRSRFFRSEQDYSQMMQLYERCGFGEMFELFNQSNSTSEVAVSSSTTVSSTKSSAGVAAASASASSASPSTAITKTAAAAVAATTDSRCRLQPTPLPPPLAQQFKTSRQQQQQQQHQQQQQGCRSGVANGISSSSSQQQHCNSRPCCSKRSNADTDSMNTCCSSTSSTTPGAPGCDASSGVGSGENGSCRRRRQKHGTPTSQPAANIAASTRSASRAREGHHCAGASCCTAASGGGSDCSRDINGSSGVRDDVDTCSDRSSQHCCCCCCCELFGHEAAAAAAAAAAVSSQTQPAGRNYPEIRDRLRLRLDQRRKREESAAAASSGIGTQPVSCSPVSSSADRSSQSDQPSSGVNRDDRDLSDLLNYIETSSSSNGATARQTNQKRAAKRERQRQKRLEQQSSSQLQQIQMRSLEEFQRRNPEVTITVVGAEQSAKSSPNSVVNGGSNGAVVTPTSSASVAPSSATQRTLTTPTSGGPSGSLVDSMTEANDGDGRMVTIRRVMEPGGSGEPKVTITLKGDKPEEDRLLMTLVNGQMRDASGSQSQQPPNEVAMTKTAKKKLKKALKLQKLREEEEAAERARQEAARLAEEEACAKRAQEKLQQQQQQQQQQKKKNKKKNKKTTDTQAKPTPNNNSNNNNSVFMTAKNVGGDVTNTVAHTHTNTNSVPSSKKAATRVNGHVAGLVKTNSSSEPPCQLLQDLTLSSDSEIEEIARTYRIPAGISISRVASNRSPVGGGGARNGSAPPASNVAPPVNGANLTAPLTTVIGGGSSGVHFVSTPVSVANGTTASLPAAGGDDKKAKKKRRKKKAGPQLTPSAGSNGAEVCLAPEVTIRKVEPCAPRCMDDYESVFMPLSSSSGLTDSVDQEVEAFKRFCLDSPQVNREQRPKVNLNIKDIFIKMRPTQ